MFDDSLVTYTIDVDVDDIPVRGNAMASGNSDFDRRVEDSILSALHEGDVWAWCHVTVTARYEGIDSVYGVATLGGCSYRDEEEFKRCTYYEDMCTEARDDLYSQIEGILARFGSLEDNHV